MDSRTFCPDCDLPMRLTHRPFVFRGVPLGIFPMYVCRSCGLVCHSLRTSRAIEKAAKAKGVWGPRPKVSPRRGTRRRRLASLR